MLIIFTAQAEADLENIADHIAIDSPRRALSFISELRSVILHLATFPSAHPRVPRFEHVEVRRKTHGDYLIFYIVEPTQLAILRILHGAQDYETILFADILNDKSKEN